jgi:23S rRNA pseudouridine1911/1915/1917 synthase
LSQATETRELEIGAAEAGERLDALLARVYPDLSRSAIQRLIDQGEVSADGKAVRPSFRPSAGQRICLRIPPPTETRLVPRALDLVVVYEDADVLVLDKPAGLVVHPAPGHADDTLANALLARYPDLQIGGALRPGIVHRLDKDTSGLLVVAKNDRAMASLVEQMGKRSVLKEYVALVRGDLRVAEGVIDAPIARNPRDRKKMAIVAGGREARTHFRVLERFPGYTLVEARLETGRTHQIRVHFASLGHPLVGDSVYGRPHEGRPHEGRSGEALGLARQFLHARRLGFALPSTGAEVVFESPLPADLQKALAGLRGQRIRPTD